MLLYMKKNDNRIKYRYSLVSTLNIIYKLYTAINAKCNTNLVAVI